MQQAYRVLRIVSEAQTIRIILSSHPGELMLKELSIACASLNTESSSGIKAVVLDFTGELQQGIKDVPVTDEAVQYATGKMRGAREPGSVSTVVEVALASIQAIAQPVLAVARATPSAAAWLLIEAADLTLVADEAVLTISNVQAGNEALNGVQAARLGYVTWSVPSSDIPKEMEHILDMLREKSAIALQLTKASTQLGRSSQTNHATALETLKQVNAFYLEKVMQTKDASEGLQAFLEKRKPNWKNM
ncbi:MAG TPA: enoyl-CoA hydratase-related protein [Ktedonobacteraceae bacterium]|nr:enoyl-CoA hydratase-related protein [Ktedonobacteraceae bacterium]